jgi:hypothetical protein
MDKGLYVLKCVTNKGFDDDLIAFLDYKEGRYFPYI